jgi:hypothetical protein
MQQVQQLLQGQEVRISEVQPFSHVSIDHARVDADDSDAIDLGPVGQHHRLCEQQNQYQTDSPTPRAKKQTSLVFFI